MKISKVVCLCITLMSIKIHTAVVPVATSPDSLETLRACSHRAIDALSILETDYMHIQHQPHTLATSAIALGAGLSAGYVLYAYTPHIDTRSKRFITGLEAPALLSAAGTAVKPAVCLIAGFYTWHKIRHLISDPYKRKLNEKMIEMKALLAKHREETDRNFARHSHAVDQEIKKAHEEAQKARINIVIIQQQVERELELMRKTTAEALVQERKASTQLHANLTRQLELFTAEQTSSTVELQAQLRKEQAELSAQVTALAGSVNASLTELKDDVKQASATNTSLQEKFKGVMPLLQSMHDSMAKIKSLSRTDVAAAYAAHPTSPRHETKRPAH